MKSTLRSGYDLDLGWFAKPSSNHIAQFYQSDEELLRPLLEYVGEGLKHGETCVVIATQRHIDGLNKLLAKANTVPKKALQNGQLIMSNAATLMKDNLVNGLPDRSRFLRTIGQIIKQAESRGKPVRAFGEVVALLWKQGNGLAVSQLEQFWNDLATEHTFSLYCAYPRRYFDSIIHASMLNKISECHTLVTPEFAPV